MTGVQTCALPISNGSGYLGYSRLIKSLVSSDRNWKTEFFFVSGFWTGNPVDVGRDTFAPYTGDLGNLRPEGMPSPFSLLFLPFYLLFVCLTFTYCFTALGRPSLSKFHRNRVHRAHLFVDRNFHSLVTLQCLAKWGLGPEPSTEAIAHEVTVRRRKFLLAQILYVIFFGLNLIFIYNYLSGMATMKENKGKEVVDEESCPETQSQARPSTRDKRKSLSNNWT